MRFIFPSSEDERQCIEIEIGSAGKMLDFLDETIRYE